MKRKVLIGLGVLLLLITGAVLATTVHWSATSTVEFEAVDGPAISLDENGDFTSDRPIPDKNTVDLGTIELSSSGQTSASLASIEGSQTTLSNVAGESILWADHTDAQRIGVQGVDGVTWDAVDLQVDETEISVTGSGTLYVDGFDPDEYVRVDLNDENTIQQADADGIVALTVSGEDITFLEASQPELHSPDPVNEERIGETPITLQAQLEHDDINAETIELSWFLNDELVQSTTTTDEGSVSIEIDNFAEGVNQWRVEAEDSTGGTDSIAGSFATPATLEIRDEINPNQLVDSVETEIEVTFFGDEQTVETRTTTDGTVDMTGLPLDEEFTVQIDADGYYTRQSIARSVVERQEIYILNETADVVESQFKIEDPTATFNPDNSRVFVKKPIERDGVTEYRVVVADDLGSGGWTTTLAQGQRYIIEVENTETGEIREMGPYVATVSEVVTLEVDEISFDFTDTIEDIPYSWNAAYQNITEPAVSFQFEADETIEEFHVTVHKQHNESVVILDETRTNYNGIIDLTGLIPEHVDNPDQTNWIVEWTAVIGGEEISSTTVVSASQLNPSIIGVGDEILSVMGVLIIFVVAGMFSQANVSIGAIVTSVVAGGLWMVGIIPDAVSGIFIALALMIGIMNHVRGGPQPR